MLGTNVMEEHTSSIFGAKAVYFSENIFINSFITECYNPEDHNIKACLLVWPFIVMHGFRFTAHPKHSEN
jgi:hypothetical protein